MSKFMKNSVNLKSRARGCKFYSSPQILEEDGMVHKF